MKILIAYYSKTGNTEIISNAIREALEANWEVDMLKIEMVKEYSSFLLHLNPRIFFDTILNRKPWIRSLEDMSPYDLIFVGTPNWYSQIAPPVNTFIEKMVNFEGKNAIAFVSSGLSGESYAVKLKNSLEKKGLRVLKMLNLKQREINDSQLKEIKEILKLIYKVNAD